VPRIVIRVFALGVQAAPSPGSIGHPILPCAPCSGVTQRGPRPAVRCHPRRGLLYRPLQNGLPEGSDWRRSQLLRIHQRRTLKRDQRSAFCR
jgi:hypothetical protein